MSWTDEPMVQLFGCLNRKWPFKGLNASKLETGSWVNEGEFRIVDETCCVERKSAVLAEGWTKRLLSH
ncbi:MAG: hypothetical protein ACTS80_00330 [Candidatus Hodgkinia cicadicola]